MKPKRRATRAPQKGKAAPPPLVPGNVILKSASGRRVAGARSEIRASNIREFLPARETLDEARRLLEDLGFRIDIVAPTHIGIRGPRELYDKVFKVRLAEKVHRDSNSFGKRTLQRYFASSASPRVPERLAGTVETIEFPGPIIYHVPPTPIPPPLGYDHMELPDDVARAMDALKAHARGITGAGIKLAMVDSGFMTPAHPYYASKGYNIQPVVPDPDDLAPNDDPHGHGTAMAACALAVAPGATFTPYKLHPTFPNASTTFSQAVMTGADIISNSWASLYDTTLKLAITNAITVQGIVVLFAIGNKGPVYWPGAEIDVISVGGVFIGEDDSLQAATEASSGKNFNVPGRQCPDLCGICGHGIYQTKNYHGMLIALPTSPGSPDYDVQFNNGGSPYPNGDQTLANDGWFVGSGTSAACAMVAGVAALVMQNDPAKRGDPPAVRATLVASCLDVTVGKSASGQTAGPGQDNATGYGLVQAYRAIRPTDLWIRDNPDSDIGLVPTHNRRPKWPPFAHWVSPDIKIFSAPLGNPGAEFDPTPTESPVFGQDSFVYVRVRNRGTGASPQVNTRLYYADPATSLVFPADWKDGQSGVPANGSLQVNGVATNLQAFPSVGAGGDNVLPLPFVWRPPNPTQATQTQILPDGRTTGHFCLLVRLESADDQIILAGGGQESVIGDNNIGMSNQDVYSAPAGRLIRFMFFVRGGRAPAATIRNDLLFDLSRLPRKSSVSVRIRDLSLEKVRLVNASRSNDQIQLRVGPSPAGLRDLALEPDVRKIVVVSLTIPPGSAPADYPIAVMQASRGQALGGTTLIARVAW